jgi:hypothetical protein
VLTAGLREFRSRGGQTLTGPQRASYDRDGMQPYQAVLERRMEHKWGKIELLVVSV